MNNNSLRPEDYEARINAIQADRSFIVQAPAGSGKTGLLTQRYLKLLSIINKPEEIIAITFTRKAAGEMRERILTALNFAQQHDQAPEDEYEAQTWSLACDALQQNYKKNWNLLEHSGRLRVQTIDSLCTELARQLPLLSEFGAIPSIIDDAQNLYFEAALETLVYLESTDPEFKWASESLVSLLKHQDNRMDKVQELIAAMLARRDQWLRHVADLKHPQLRRDQIEPVLQGIVKEALESLNAVIPFGLKQQIPELLRFAAEFAPQGSMIRNCFELDTMPATSVDDVPQWLAVAELLLTSDGNWRKPKGVNKKLGFLAEKDAQDAEQKLLFKNQKKKLQLILESLSEQILADEFKNTLSHVRILPHFEYTDDEWMILEALFKVLLFSAAQLRRVFSSHGEVDFIEMLLAAKRALGDAQQPTDLSLRLDYQLKHLLVDEFQDTSQNQFDLFTQLTSGWQTDDGRTLFLVGDPMQSIYRFREAEVGLFLQAWNNGIGDISLEALNLTVNFRSQKPIIDWVNNKFPRIFPKDNDKTLGAVVYTKFNAFKSTVDGSCVQLHPLFGRDDIQEAKLVIELIKQEHRSNSDARIAVLCRNKSHLLEIVAQLNKHSISYQAVDIDLLNNQSVVQDLLSLTKALLHLADKISWLALLRAPFIGLTLNDIHLLTFEHSHQTVLQCLGSSDVFSQLSADGQMRLQRVVPLLNISIENSQRNTLRHWVEGLWMALGGPACCNTATAVDDVEVYFQLLESLENQKELLESDSLDKHCQKLFALVDSKASDKVQLMTIHKSKGLEFETVIIPGLGKTTASDKSKLLYWCERTNESGIPELVFSPIKSVWENTNQTTEYLKYLEQEKIKFEVSRLLYVAVTRAKQKLHLLGHVNLKSDASMAEPASNSLLSHLWPIAQQQFIQEFECLPACDDNHETEFEHVDSSNKTNLQFTNTSRLRLVDNWQCPAVPQDIIIESAIISLETDEMLLEFDWASETAKHVGSVVHRVLEQLSHKSLESLNTADEILKITHSSRIMLNRLGVIDEQLAPAVERVINAITSTLSDTRGQWILSGQHQLARSEYKITAEIDGEIRHMIIDRTFIDDDGIRWVIDYKTGHHQGGSLAAFLDSEQQRYQAQLQRYAQVMQLMEPCEIKMALYFPMMQQWREWAAIT